MTQIGVRKATCRRAGSERSGGRGGIMGGEGVARTTFCLILDIFGKFRTAGLP